MSRNNAFTFVEMLIALVIISMIGVMAFPAMKSLLDGSRSDIAREQMRDMLQHARLQANAKMTTVIITLNDNKRQLLAFTDDFHDGKLHERSQLLTRIDADIKSILHLRSYPHYRSYFMFQPNHMNHTDNGSIWSCQNQSRIEWAMTINASGTLHFQYPNKDGLILDSHGKPLSCQ